MRVRDQPLLVGVSKESVSTATGVLEKADLVTFEPDPDGGRSHVILLPPDERQVLLDRMRLQVETDPALAGRPEISLPYETHRWRCCRP